MVRLTLKPSCREASCCSLLVVKGAVALRRRSFFSTFLTDHLAVFSAATTASVASLSGSEGVSTVSTRGLDSLDTDEARGKLGRLLCRRQLSVDRPIFHRNEGLDLTLPLDNQPQSDGLHTSCGKAPAHFIPEQRRDLVAHDTVEHTACLLRVNQMLVDISRSVQRPRAPPWA